jgi:hypothetical protein
LDIEAKIDAIVDDFANSQIRDEIAPSKKNGLWMGAWCRLATGSRTARFTGAEGEGDDPVSPRAHVCGVRTGPLHRFFR